MSGMAGVAGRARRLTAVATPGDVFAAVILAAVQAGGSYAISSRHGQAISPAGYALLVTGPAALLGRRRFPVAVLAVTAAAAVGFVGLEPAGGLPYFALIVAFVNAVLAGRRWAAVTGLVISYAGILWLPGLTGAGNFPSAGFAFGVAAWHLALFSGAEWYRSRRQRAQAVAHGREEEARRQATEERLRIARELHDVVAHSLSVINVQANTALHLIDQQPDRARSTLTVINDVSKQALVELRSVLGVLRQVDEELPRSPAPSLERISELIARATAAGISVGVSEEGARCALPANVDLAGYRILQEALTNSARHAPGAQVAVRVAYQPRGLMIQVDDDGAAGPAAAPNGPASGHSSHRTPGNGSAGNGSTGQGAGNGIAGMTERARALGGTLRAGPDPGGGFRVRAWLPHDGQAS
jgi:signal transduction histidine kinase